MHRVFWHNQSAQRTTPAIGISRCAVLYALLLVVPTWGAEEKLHVAVASNFTAPMKEIAVAYEKATSRSVVLSSGSTGKHYTQIKHGAPFQAFFAADVQRPRRLEREGDAVKGSRFTYAVGRIVLWSPRENYVDPKGDVLQRGDFRYLAIANPRLAPYGEAARQVLEKEGLWESLRSRIVRGENISQAYQFVASGNAELGFVASSQLAQPGAKIKGSYWDVPESLYSPIEQQAVLLEDTREARSFLEFARSEPALKIIRKYGYSIPERKKPQGGEGGAERELNDLRKVEDVH